jgi:hypothetical protein
MPHQQSVNSLRKIRRLKLRLDDDVQVTRVGSHYKARFRGHRNCVFGSTREEAIDRLRKTSLKSFKNSTTNAATAERNWAYGFREAKG